jgi:hypothetical protein
MAFPAADAAEAFARPALVRVPRRAFASITIFAGRVFINYAKTNNISNAQG